ncbi:hypothetical protein RB595_005180 [Gaeumannomyces hyphopodioides]
MPAQLIPSAAQRLIMDAVKAGPSPRKLGLGLRRRPVATMAQPTNDARPPGDQGCSIERMGTPIRVRYGHEDISPRGGECPSLTLSRPQSMILALVSSDCRSQASAGFQRTPSITRWIAGRLGPGTRRTMKVLVAGATGLIGSEALLHCLDNPQVTSVVAFARRPLAKNVQGNGKLTTVLMEDFGDWPEDRLGSVKDADAMIWALGTLDGDTTANLDYPLAFMSSFVRILEKKAVSGSQGSEASSKFRFIYLSGQMVETDQSKDLHLIPAARKIKSVFETEAMKFMEEHDQLWQTLIVRPGGVLPKDTIATSVLGLVIGKNWSVRVEEVGAFVAYLAIHGSKDRNFFENEDILKKGRQLHQAGDFAS